MTMKYKGARCLARQLRPLPHPAQLHGAIEESFVVEPNQIADFHGPLSIEKSMLTEQAL